MAGRGDAHGAPNARPWLERASSSDMAFFNMVFETSQRVSAAAKSQGYRELDCRTVGSFGTADGHLAGTGSLAVEAVCIDGVPAPPRNVVACPDRAAARWLVECAANTVAVAGPQGVVWAAEFARDVRCAWWIDDDTIGVLAAAEQHGTLELFAVDIPRQGSAAAPSTTRLCLQVDRASDGPRSAPPPLHVAAQGPHVVCTVAASDPAPNEAALWHWRLDRGPAQGAAAGPVRVAECGWVRPRHPPLLALRWIGAGVGLAATRDGGFWFGLAPQVQTADLACDLRCLDMLPWRWQEAVVAADALPLARLSLPPSRPVLCLPGPTGASFYRLDAATYDTALLARRAFPDGWVWLCASAAAYAILSPCRRQATVCRMPLGEPMYTVRIHASPDGDGDVVQDGWMLGDTPSCALSTGTGIFVVCPAL
ncbi:hypothetical protein IWQ57_002423 [Coemansia nantahalensis]|uniref:Uncharacterized protein n=1 Tax=Coemansia nantahalensis TaxID=2789366 RepID=A0ACC1K0G9_9FUNG|nr:hypothetical protein IWQ57_002423 [Coemansia nantahalensis]